MFNISSISVDSQSALLKDFNICLTFDNWFVIPTTYICTKSIIEAGINQSHHALIAKYIDQIQNTHVTTELRK